MSILFSRFTILILIFCITLAIELSFIIYIINFSTGIFSGLFHITITNFSFQIFIFLISGIILQLSGFLPKKIFIKKFSNIYS